MIVATVTKQGQVIMKREYYDPKLTLDSTIEKLEQYIIAEDINKDGECRINAKHADLVC